MDIQTLFYRPVQSSLYISFYMLSLQWFDTSLCVSCDTFMTLRAEAAGVKQGDMGKLQ